MRLQVCLPLTLFLILPGITFANTVKMSSSGICHSPESPFYNRTKNFTPYPSITDCLSAGGRLPKGQRSTAAAKNTAQASNSNYNRTSTGNRTNQSFNKAKRILEREVYPNHRITLYCGAAFDANNSIFPLPGFSHPKYKDRQKRLEWEHVVPAENFGRTFSEWRDGHEQCVDSKGNRFKGRKCAEKMNTEYRYMQSDMHNLFPAIGAVNAMRSNYNFALLPEVAPEFGSCRMKIEGRKVEPSEEAKGRIARTYKYMADAYPRFILSKQQKRLMEAWDQEYPVDWWECNRTKMITKLQGNPNTMVQVPCEMALLW